MNLSPSRLQTGLHLSVIMFKICSLETTDNCWDLVSSCYDLRLGNVIVCFSCLIMHIGYRSCTRCNAIFKQEPLSSANGRWWRCPVRCVQVQDDATWLGQRLLSSGCSSHATRGEIHVYPANLFIHFKSSWGVAVLFAWICYILGAQASPWRSPGCAEVGSWEWRDWERTTVTCYLLFTSQWRAVSICQIPTGQGHLFGHPSLLVFLYAIISIMGSWRAAYWDYGWVCFIAVGFCRKAMELMKVSPDEDEQWSVADWLWAACGAGGHSRIMINS